MWESISEAVTFRIVTRGFEYDTEVVVARTFLLLNLRDEILGSDWLNQAWRVELTPVSSRDTSSQPDVSTVCWEKATRMPSVLVLGPLCPAIFQAIGPVRHGVTFVSACTARFVFCTLNRNNFLVLLSYLSVTWSSQRYALYQMLNSSFCFSVYNYNNNNNI